MYFLKFYVTAIVWYLPYSNNKDNNNQYILLRQRHVYN